MVVEPKTKWKHKITGYVVILMSHNPKTGRVCLKGETGRSHRGRMENLKKKYNPLES